MFTSWHDITSLANLFTNVTRYRTEKSIPTDTPYPVFVYRGKIKLHGTNAAIRIENKTIYAQSRTQDLSPDSTNNGFYNFVMLHKDFYMQLTRFNAPVVVYGEWCGPGVQSGTALNQIPQKIFAIYAIKIGDSWVIDPKKIQMYLGELPPNTYVLPWATKEYTINFGIKDKSVVEEINSLIASIELEDPWVKDTFGISGTGEGLVFYPVDSNLYTHDNRSYHDWGRWMFKAKGEKHRVKKEKAPVVIDNERIESINEFIDTFLTSTRVAQAINATNTLSKADTGKFMKWISEDILKESKNELEESGLLWSDIVKPLQTKARQMLFTLLENME